MKDHPLLSGGGWRGDQEAIITKKVIEDPTANQALTKSAIITLIDVAREAQKSAREKALVDAILDASGSPADHIAREFRELSMRGGTPPNVSPITTRRNPPRCPHCQEKTEAEIVMELDTVRMTHRGYTEDFDWVTSALDDKAASALNEWFTRVHTDIATKKTEAEKAVEARPDAAAFRRMFR